MILDHLFLPVSDLGASVRFYVPALAPVGAVLIEQRAGVAAFGPPGKPQLFLQESAASGATIHVGFVAPDRTSVRAFHAAAIAAGGCDNGPPGLRPDYHRNYFGAFVLDPDGHNIEVVCHAAEH